MWFPALATLVAVAYGYSRSRRPGGLVINHVTTFTLGFLFYWVFPSLLATVPVPDAAVSMLGSLLDYVHGVPEPRMLGYSIAILFCFLAFAAGDTLGVYPIIKKRQLAPKRIFEAKLWRAEWMVAFPIFVVVAVKLRGDLYGSYTDANSFAKGTLVAISLVLFSISLRLALENRWRFMHAYFGCSLALLASGGRLYFVSSVIALLAYFSHRKPIRTKVLLFGGSAAILLMGLVGVLRIHAQASAIFIFLNIATESLFTSFSLFSYLLSNPIAWIKAPTFLFADLANLVPSVLMDKHNLVKLTDSAYEIASPMGAMNSWVSFNVNFGVLGTLLFLFLFGYLMRRHEKMSVPYLMLTGFTAFTFFRDPFSVSLVKNMLEFSILIPLLLERLNHWAAVVIRRQQQIGFDTAY